MFCSASTQAGGFLHTRGTAIVDGKEQAILLRGVNLGGWLMQEGYMLQLRELGAQNRIRAKIEEIVGGEAANEFSEAWLDNAVTKADIDRIAQLGFNSVRVPLHHALFVDGDGKPRRQGFARLDKLVRWAKADGLYLILDLHAAPGGQGTDLAISDRDPARPSLWESADNMRLALDLWKAIAKRYHRETTIAAYDLLNEPNWDFGPGGGGHGCEEKANGPLGQFLTDATAAIRQVDQRHIIVVEGNCWGNNYAGLLPFADANAVLSFHKYGSPNDDKSIADILALRDRYQMPIWLGETGENTNDWYRAAIALVEANEVGWAFWPWKKMGTSSPQEIVANAGWPQLAAWMTGKGPQPSIAEAREALMQLARHDVRIEQNREHDDVVAAILPQTTVRAR